MVIFLFALTPQEQQSVIEMVELYSKDLYNFAYRLTLNRSEAEDLFQQTWVKVVNNFDKYKEDKFRSWLFKICSNQFKDNYRKSVRYRKIVKDDFGSSETKDYVINSANSKDDTYIKVEHRDTKKALLHEIYNLPEKQRKPIIMFYYQAMKYDEIATTLDIPVGTVRSRINTAKVSLKKHLQGAHYV